MSRRERLSRLLDAFFGSPFAPLELPALREASIDYEAVLRTARVHQLAELGRREVREVSVGVLTDPDRLLAHLRDSIEDRCILWVCVVNSADERDAIEAALPALVRVLGEHRSGATVIGLHTASITRSVIVEHPEKLGVFTGIDTAYLPRDIVRSLTKAKVSLTHTSALMRLAREPKSWVYLTIFIYSSLRALPVMFVPQFHGSLLWLWIIDIGTAIPYTWGLLAMFTAAVPWVRLAGMVTTVVTFIAPYVYFWLHGDDYPPYITIVIVGMIVASVGVEVWRFRQERKLQRTYAACEAA
ncbi:hypothetical protein [Schaalia sp. Marseille-Q2122]|uniref:hypothetical protein n=1 Tax=Schaalia sp. Marseille-Q2122 TaxID=2736604 RepID=UPI00158D0B6E|nr:hypothetical protein [Schaalia sp. Marseille-Q2122]